MKRFLASAVVLLSLGCSFQPGLSSMVGSDPATPADAPILSFSRLSAGHALLVRYQSTGCWHYFNVEFRFDGGSPLTVTATHIETEWDNEARNEVETGRVPIGSMALSGNDARALDSLIVYYRTGPEPACEAIDRIAIHHLFKGEPFAAERYVDQSCRLWEMSEEEMEKIPILTFWDLLKRFRSEWPDEMMGD